MLACMKAIQASGNPFPLPKSWNAGISFFTAQGERYPAAWRKMMERNERVRPTQFESIIHNAAPGYAAIQLGLIGPQLTLTYGDPHMAAELQLLAGRSKFMLVCKSELEGPAECYALEVAA